MSGKLSFEKFKEEWLKEVLANTSSNTIKGRKFAKKIFNEWSQLSDNNAIIYGDQNNEIIYGFGDKDGGVDLGYFSPKDNQEENGPDGDTWYLIQTIYGKAFEDGNSLLIESRKLIYALDGHKQLPSIDVAEMNRLIEFQRNASDNDRFVLILATIDPLSDDEKELILNIKEIGVPRLGQNFDVVNVNLKMLFNRLNEDNENKVIVVPLIADLVQGEVLLIGSVKLENLYKFLKEYEIQREGDFDLIYKKNVRMFLGGGKHVNRGITDTIRSNPERFGLYNNGITIVVEDFNKISNSNRYELMQPHIVNGCQTTKIIYTELKKKLENPSLLQNREHQKYLEKLRKGNLVVKIVKAANDDVGKLLLKDTTRFTNSQNVVNVKDFIALEDKFQNWKAEMAAEFDFFLEIQKGEYKSKEKLDIDLSSNWANAFDLIKVFGASMLDAPAPGTAFGKNSPFAPAGSIFRKIVDNKLFGPKELFACYLLLKLAKENHFGERGYESKRGKTGYLFCFVFVQLLKDVMKNSGFQTDINNFSEAIILILNDLNSESARRLNSDAVGVIEDYMTTDKEFSMSKEVKYIGDSNAYLKNDKLGSSDWSPNLVKLIEIQKKACFDRTNLIAETLSSLKKRYKTAKKTDSVTGRKPVKLTILSTKYEVDSWKRVLLLTLNSASKINERKLRNFIDITRALSRNRENNFRNPGILENGYSVETNHSADTIFNICSEVQSAFGWGSEDWILEFGD